jgi:hypothetical protein
MRRQLKTELDREMVIAQIKRLDLTKSYSIEINLKRKIRSISQNNLYWLWLTCIEFETGNDRYYMHEYYKEIFIIPEVIEVRGKKIEVKTTTNKDTLTFKNFLDKVQIDANTEWEIKLPLPEEQYWDEFYSFYIDKL